LILQNARAKQDVTNNQAHKNTGRSTVTVFTQTSIVNTPQGIRRASTMSRTQVGGIPLDIRLILQIYLAGRLHHSTAARHRGPPVLRLRVIIRSAAQT
jgi:hypothetical protein